MILLLIVFVFELMTGNTAYYAPNVMERVARNRGLPEHTCMVATPYADLGEYVIVNGEVCFVMDVPHPKDRDSIIQRGITVELDWNSYRRICGKPRRPNECKTTLMILK